ncbi:enoyl-CoA hydratase/isomerase family protein [Conexibacter sp. DBS9H8]|uniref:enoyl-CoA hydratase/isomerase family protein n=1 Tax=Conexibacter sp. DBS9H8 TaxID=2937801 RepID=UPI00200E77C0|nr:enoyl-CoA hydratase/isomerase family protein [Conexibacter sp. DBS9H8]
MLTVTLNRPAVHNALHPEQLGQLLEIVRAASADPTLRLLAVTGAGTKAFSAGFDIRALQIAKSETPPPSQILFAVTAALIACPVPTLALVRGYCAGAGLDLAMSCDHRIATADATFWLPAANLGTVYEPRSLERFQAILGPSVAKRLFMCGHRLEASEALRVGLIDQLVEAASVDDRVDNWVAASPALARSHKHILDEFAKPADRSEQFWAPLDRLRLESTRSAERARALTDFVTTSDKEHGDA